MLRLGLGLLGVIISASRRTDIPAFYAKWLWQRIEEGYATVPNPMNPKQVAEVSLRVQDVDAIVFWTRHAAPLLPLVPKLQERGYKFYVQYTITGYGQPLEARTPPLEVAIRTFARLARLLPSGSVVWRYDPVILGPALPPQMHLERFAHIAAALQGHARRVVVSLLSRYRKTERRVAKLMRWGDDVAWESGDHPQLTGLLARMVEVASRHHMSVEGCCLGVDAAPLGIEPTRCVDGRLLAELFGGTWSQDKDPGQRPLCRCTRAKDIGMTDTCLFGCAYCYATSSDARAHERHQEHDPNAPSLHGRHRPTHPSCKALRLF